MKWYDNAVSMVGHCGHMDISEVRERLEQPEVGSETVSVSLSCPELSVNDRNKRAGRDRKED